MIRPVCDWVHVFIPDQHLTFHQSKYYRGFQLGEYHQIQVACLLRLCPALTFPAIFGGYERPAIILSENGNVTFLPSA